MHDIQFKVDQINKKFFHGDIGTSFQQFVYELLLPERPNLHIFPTGGKDGGIDISERSENSSTFIECKYIGKDGFDAAYSRWKEVAKHLENHLSNPSKPTAGQRQYSPWYCTDFPVTEYIFCISSTLANEDQLRRLYKEIKDFFVKLSNKYNHLAHLGFVSVTVLDWNDLYTRLKRYPHILLSWFPKSRPSTLIPLEEASEIGSFRAYLHSDLLPYYARHEHLKLFPSPPNLIIPDEQELLFELSASQITGLIITGKGGVGKTRLTLEIGKLARRDSWIVFQCSRKVKANDVVHLTETINANQKVLILIDYIEIQDEFIEFIENVAELNKDGKFHIRYVANCRTNFYYSLVIQDNYKRVNLSPFPQDTEAAWLETFQEEIVSHILKNSQLNVTPEHRQICRNRPAFAAFLSYLKKLGRNDELIELLEEKDFSGWVTKRLKLTFGETITSRKLAEFIMFFPLPSDYYFPSGNDFVDVFNQLATDGWIEKTAIANSENNQEMWVVAHDVLADQIILSYLNSIPYTVENFIKDSLIEAVKFKSFHSALIAVQRIADQPPAASLNWFKVLSQYILTVPIGSPIHDRATLIKTSLLSPDEKIRLLKISKEYWEGAEKEIEFQNTIGWLARWAQSAENSSISDIDKATLTFWINKSVSYVSESNYVLTSGLKFCPETVKDAAFHWISNRPQEFQTHYLIVAWLEAGFLPSEIELSVWLWTTHFMNVRQLSFVASAWLDSKGDPELISDNIFMWLEDFSSHPDTDFVYRSWLDSGREFKLIQKYIYRWFQRNPVSPKADYLYKFWLNFDGELSEISRYVILWLKVHCEEFDSYKLLITWLSKGGDEKIAEEYILRWLRIWGPNYNTFRMFYEWVNVGGSLETIKSFIIDWLLINKDEVGAAFIYQLWLKNGEDKEQIKPYIINWIRINNQESLAVKIYILWFKFYDEKEFILSHFLPWLEKHSTKIQAYSLFDYWIKSGKSLSTIITYVFSWLEANWNERYAIKIVKLITLQNNVAPNLITDWLLNLCIKEQESITSFRCLSKIIVNSNYFNYPDAVYSTSIILLKNIIISNEPNFRDKHNQIAHLLGLLLTNTQLSQGPYREQINNLLIYWLKSPIFLEKHLKNPKFQSPLFLHHIKEILMEGELNIAQHENLLKHILTWMNKWKVEVKEQMREDLKFLSNNFPRRNLWSILTFD